MSQPGSLTLPDWLTLFQAGCMVIRPFLGQDTRVHRKTRPLRRKDSQSALSVLRRIRRASDPGCIAVELRDKAHFVVISASGKSIEKSVTFRTMRGFLSMMGGKSFGSMWRCLIFAALTSPLALILVRKILPR